jgi:aldose 1-epimerase
VLSLELRLGARWVDLWRPTPPAPVRSSDTASFLLAPWSNRIRDGRFRFRGRDVVLRHGEKHSIHGDVRDRPWRVRHCAGGAARLELDATELPDRNFPFPFRVEAWLRLEGAQLQQGLALENAGDEAMPAGLGFHPYWMRALGGADESVELALRTQGVYPGEPPVPMLPSGPPVALAPEQDFSRLRPLDSALDHCFAGWDGRAVVRWPKSGVTATLVAGSRLRHLVVYSPLERPYFALEPVSHANDGFNLMDQGIGGTGVAVLEPGARMEAMYDIRVEVA